MNLTSNISLKDYYKTTTIFSKYLRTNLTQSQIEELNRLLGLTEELYNSPLNPKLVQGLKSMCDELGVKVYEDLEHSAMSYFHPGEGKYGSIHISDNPLPHIFAHELGHAYSFNGKGTWKDRLSHKFYGLGKLLMYILDSTLGLGTTLVSGHILSKSGPVKYAGLLVAGLMPYVIYSPTLYQEKYASKMGLKFLTDLGADEDYLKMSKTSLMLAYKSYSSTPFQVMIKNLISYGLGMGSGALTK